MIPAQETVWGYVTIKLEVDGWVWEGKREGELLGQDRYRTNCVVHTRDWSEGFRNQFLGLHESYHETKI